MLNVNHFLTCHNFKFVRFFFFLISPEALAQILRETGESMASMQTAINRYVALLQANNPEVSHIFQIAYDALF